MSTYQLLSLIALVFLIDLGSVPAASGRVGQPDGAAATGDRSKPPTVEESSRILTMFQRLRFGMTPQQVEALVGQPALKPTQQPNGDLQVWYIDRPERKLGPQESPWGPAGILVIYRQGILAEKKYNSQWVKK